MGRGNNGHLFDDFEVEARVDVGIGFLGIVGQQTDFRQPQIFQNLNAYGEVPAVRFESQLDVGLYRIISLVLQNISFEFGNETDPATFLRQINDGSCTCLIDGRHGHM